MLLLLFVIRKQLKILMIIYIITGIGKHIIEEFYIENTLIIDCGISRDENNKLLRDVIRYEYSDNIYYGSVGVVTCACVAYNTLKAYKLQNGLY